MKLLFAIFIVLQSSLAFSLEIQEVNSSKCGIKALLVEEHNLPIISMHIAFGGAGSAYGEDGLAMMTANLLDKGAGDLNSYDFTKKLEEISSSMGFGVDKDFLHVNLKTLTVNREKALELLVLALTNPQFDEKEIELVRKKMLSAIKQLSSNPRYIANKLWNQNAFGNHPYSKSAYGNVGSVNSFKKQGVMRFFKNSLSRDMYISIAGDINEIQASLFLDKLCGFPKLLQKSIKGTSVQEFNISQEFDTPQSVVVFGSKGIKRNDAAFFTVYLLNHIVGSGNFSSRLMKKIRVEKGLVYGIGAYLSSYEKVAVWKGSFSTKNETVDEAISLVKQEIKTVIEKGVTVEELSKAKQYLTGSFVLNLDSTDNIISYLFSIQRFNLGLDYFKKRNEYIKRVF